MQQEMASLHDRTEACPPEDSAFTTGCRKGATLTGGSGGQHCEQQQQDGQHGRHEWIINSSSASSGTVLQGGKQKL